MSCSRRTKIGLALAEIQFRGARTTMPAELVLGVATAVLGEKDGFLARGELAWEVLTMTVTESDARPELNGWPRKKSG